MSQAYTGGSPAYEREGRYFVEAGIGTIGWGVYPLYTEVDFNGTPIGDGISLPMEWIFPDPVAVAEQKKRKEAERQRLEQAETFPVEGMSGEFNDGVLDIWPTGRDCSDSVTLGAETCDFCRKKTTTVTASAGYDSLEVCRDCLIKMFDVFEAQGQGE